MDRLESRSELDVGPVPLILNIPEGTVQVQERCAAGPTGGRWKRWYDECAKL